MDKYLFVFQTDNPDQFVVKFGANLVNLSHDDITRGFGEVAHQLLGKHKFISDAKSPDFGLWYIPFSLKEPDIPVDANEQIKALTDAGKQLIRKMLQQNFGMATGTRMDFKLVILSHPELMQGQGDIDAYIRSALCEHPSVGKPYAHMSREDFKKIINSRNLQIYLQPIVSLSQGNIVGYEALSRGPANSPIYQAANLFGTAAHFGLGDDLEIVCILKALECLEKLPEPLWLSINISPDLITSPCIRDIISFSNMKDRFHRMIFEITEHLPIPETIKLKRVVQDLEVRGISLALDDTGCGFADIDTAKILRPKIVKLCITVTRRIGRHSHITRDIRRIVGRIGKLGGEVLGEGVEQREQVEVLKESGVIYAQGYFYGQPKPTEEAFKDMEIIRHNTVY